MEIVLYILLAIVATYWIWKKYFYLEKEKTILIFLFEPDLIPKVKKEPSEIELFIEKIGDTIMESRRDKKIPRSIILHEEWEYKFEIYLNSLRIYPNIERLNYLYGIPVKFSPLVEKDKIYINFVDFKYNNFENNDL